MKRANVYRGINLLLAVMLLALGLYPSGSVSAQGRRFLSPGQRALQAETSGSIRYVKPNGSTIGGCQSWNTACDLQTALAVAISGDQLWVAGGVYTPGASGDVTATFQLKDGVNIYGGFAGDETALGQRNWTAHPSILSGDIDQNDVTQNGVVTNTAQIKGENAYHVVSAINITNALLDGFTITAGNANSTTIPEERGAGMYADNSKITVRHVTFSGNSANYGGGMYNDGGSSLSLTHVTFSGNSADTGGGMANWFSSPSLTDVTFFGNSATSSGSGMFNWNSSPSLTGVTFSGNSAVIYGGGMYNDGGSSPSLKNVTFSGNSAGNWGGGMDNENSSPSLADVIFSGNSAVMAGGGMANSNSSPSLINVTFSSNSADSGGGMFNSSSSSPSLTNVTFSGNSTKYGGGGMDNLNSSPKLTNVTFSGNSAGQFGGGMDNYNSSNPILTNAILWGNTPDQIYNDPTPPASTSIITYSDIQAGQVYTGTGNINLDPLFVDAAKGDLHLQSTSPAIDAGDNAAPGLVGITTDLDGNPRFVDVLGVADTGSGSPPIVDMGAYEAPEIIYVDQHASGPTHDGTSWGNAFQGLQAGLAAAISEDELWVAEGTYTPGASGVVTATFQLKNGVEIYGGFAGDETALGQRNWAAHPTILSGDIDQNDVTQNGVVTNTAQIKGANAYHVVSASAITNTVVLDGFIITAGSSDSTTYPKDRGAGMYAVNSKITIRNVIFSGNSAVNYGSGMYNGGGSPTLRDVTFSGNSASYGYGGGMANQNGGSPSLMGVTFSGNSALEGGGMYNGGGSPTLEDVTFSGNSAADIGGGMYISGGSPSLTHVTFSGNTAMSDGGGMANWPGSSPSLTDVTFSGNSAGVGGGGMLNWNSSPSLINVTFSGNTATNNGGGVDNNGSSPKLTNVTLSGNAAGKGGGMYNEYSSSPSLTNAILWGNTPDQIYNDASTPTITYSDIQGGVSGTGNIKGDPLFVYALGGNLRLQPTSPAIDAGDNAAPGLVGITTDLDGSPRKVDVPAVADTGSGSPPIVDMGAYEAQNGGKIIYVDQDAPGPTHDGTSWGNAFQGLQAGLAAAGAGSAIWVAEGTYTPGVTGVVTATFLLKNGVNIYGGFAGDESALGQRSWSAHPSILSGDIDQNDVTQNGVVTYTAQIKGANAYHVVSANSITNMAVLDGFTITAGNATGTYPEDLGAGMYAVNSKITLRNVIFSGNSATDSGGGMVNQNGSNPSLTNVTFSGNSAGLGGGMYNLYSNPSLTHATFSGNSATSYGGGMANWGSIPTLTGVTFSGNSSGYEGGGTYNVNNSSPSLMDVTFSGNSASYGGGMFNQNGSSPSLTNVTFSGNRALYGWGGGMYNWKSSSPKLTNVTFSGNSAGKGGGMYNDSSSPSLTNAILWGNTPAGNQIYNNNGSTPIITYSDIQLQAGVVYTGTHNVNRDPRFVDAAKGDLHLQSTSPAIDAGDNAAPGLAGITTDLDDNPRFADVLGVADTGSGSPPIVDMGAYEHPYVPIQIFLPLLARH